MLLVLSVYVIYWRETRQYQRNVHLIIQLKPSNPGKRFIEMQLVYLNDIFEDNQNIVCDLFETNSVNVMKNRLLVAKEHQEISMYINLQQTHCQPWKSSLGTTTLKSSVSHTGL